MTREEQINQVAEKAADEVYTYTFQGWDDLVGLFKEGVKWADENPDGKMFLYVLGKGVKQGKREMLDKTCEWLENNLLNYWQQANTDSSKFIEDFRKAMSNETE